MLRKFCRYYMLEAGFSNVEIQHHVGWCSVDVMNKHYTVSRWRGGNPSARTEAIVLLMSADVIENNLVDDDIINDDDMIVDDDVSIEL